MRHQDLALAALCALSLAACSQEKAPEPGPGEEASVAAPETPAPVAAAPAASATPFAPVTAIPQAVRGRWGLVPADCTSTRGDAKGLLTIDATSLKFYESVAKLGTVKETDDDSIDAGFAFTGEGQSWTLDVTLDVEDDGKVLIRRDTGRDALPGPQKYTRCS